MVGSILISGRRTGQARLDLVGDRKTGVPEKALATPTNPNASSDDVCFDAQQKLDSVKASPSPVQSEIDFLEVWLKLAEDQKTVQNQESTAAVVDVKEVPEKVVPIKSNVIGGANT